MLCLVLWALLLLAAACSSVSSCSGKKNNFKGKRMRMNGAAAFNDDVVQINLGQTKADPCVITVNCKDKLGLACDISRIVFEFSLRIVRADMSTDGKWCYVILWVVPNPGSDHRIRWATLKKRLVAACPPSLDQFYYNKLISEPKPKDVYLLRLCLADGVDLLNDATQLLWEMELTIHKAKVWTKPDGFVMNLYYITDNRDLIDTKKRQEDIVHHLQANLGAQCTHCELWLALPEYKGLECTTTALSPSIVEDLLSFYLPNTETVAKCQGFEEKLNKITINVDNTLSPSHTVLQVACQDQRSFLYDITKVLKDYSIQVSYARFAINPLGYVEGDIFISQSNGSKIVDTTKQIALCDRLKMEIAHPVRVMAVSRGPDTELVVANPLEVGGSGRPRVFYNVTRTLRNLNINIFTADFGRHVIDDRLWEVQRFLLVDRPDLALGSAHGRNDIAECVRSILIA